MSHQTCFSPLNECSYYRVADIPRRKTRKRASTFHFQLSCNPDKAGDLVLRSFAKMEQLRSRTVVKLFLSPASTSAALSRRLFQAVPWSRRLSALRLYREDSGTRGLAHSSVLRLLSSASHLSSETETWDSAAFQGLSLCFPSSQSASQPDKCGCRCSCIPKNSEAVSPSGSKHQLEFVAPPDWHFHEGFCVACRRDNEQLVRTSLRVSFTSDCWLTHHQLEMLCFLLCLSSVSILKKKSVISISGCVSVCCYGTCEVHKAAVSPGNMLRPPPRDESLSCPGVSRPPLRLYRLYSTQDRPRLQVAWSVSYHFLLPVSILILSYVLPPPPLDLI